MEQIIQSLRDNKAIDLNGFTFGNIQKVINEYPMTFYYLYRNGPMDALATAGFLVATNENNSKTPNELKKQEEAKLRPKYKYVVIRTVYPSSVITYLYSSSNNTIEVNNVKLLLNAETMIKKEYILVKSKSEITKKDIVRLVRADDNEYYLNINDGLSDVGELIANLNI